MTKIFTMPDIGEGMAEGEIANWLVNVGDVLEPESEVAEVQNDKLLQEILSPFGGKVTKLFVDAGTVVKVGEPLIEFDGDGSGDTAGVSETAEETTTEEAPIDTPKEESVKPAAEPTGKVGVQTNGNGTVMAMPAVRQFARQNNVDLATVVPTGRHGHITMQDVQNPTAVSTPNAVETPVVETVNTTAVPNETPSAPVTPVVDGQGEYREAMSPMRKAIATNMVHQTTTIPHVTLMDEVDVTKLVEHRAAFKELMAKEDIKLTYLPYIAKALAAVAHRFPMLNAHADMTTNEVVFNENVNLGIAVSVPDGLVVPSINHAQSKSIKTMAVEIADLATRARDNKLKPGEMGNSTISISNIGSAGGGFFTPVINTNEAAILGVGRIYEAPTVNAEGEIVVGQMLRLSLSFDHRLIDGVMAQQAMNMLKSMLADPAMMLMEV